MARGSVRLIVALRAAGSAFLPTAPGGWRVDRARLFIRWCGCGKQRIAPDARRSIGNGHAGGWSVRASSLALSVPIWTHRLRPTIDGAELFCGVAVALRARMRFGTVWRCLRARLWRDMPVARLSRVTASSWHGWRRLMRGMLRVLWRPVSGCRGVGDDLLFERFRRRDGEVAYPVLVDP